jgi:hypothetical protein
VVYPFQARRPATHIRNSRIADNALGGVTRGPMDRLVEAPADPAAAPGLRTAVADPGSASTRDVRSPLAVGARRQAVVHQRLR